MKRFSFGLLGVLVSVILLAAVVLFFPPAFKFGLRTANRFLPVAVEIEAYSHVPGELSISGLRVATSRATLLETATLQVRYRPVGFVLGKIEVSALELENPHVTLQRSEDGRVYLFEPSSDVEQQETE